MNSADAKRALGIGVGAGTLARKIETHRDPFEPAPTPKPTQYKCKICAADKPCWMPACQERAARAAIDLRFEAAMSDAYGGSVFADASPNDVLSGPGITIWDLPAAQ